MVLQSLNQVSTLNQLVTSNPMPLAALKSMAGKAGVSPDKAERVWSKVKNATKGKGKDQWAYTMGAVKKALKIESTIEEVTKGQSITSALDDLVQSEYAPMHEHHTSISERENLPLDSSTLKLFFDAYGDLKFSTPDGIQVNERTELMSEIVLFTELASSDSGITELIDGYEGTPTELRKLLSDRFHLI